jgi:hypothetical protein
LEPVTFTEAALVALTVRVSDCPAEMLLDEAVMETTGREADALLANADKATKVSKVGSDGRVFTGPPYINLSWIDLGDSGERPETYCLLGCQAEAHRLER